MRITNRKAETLVRNALITGYRRLAAEGKAAKDIAGKQVDVTTRGDLIVGEAIVDVFRQKGDFLAYTEEQGLLKLSENPKYTAIIDDIDGTLNFKFGRGMLPHGSIVGIFSNTEPRFNDCLASGFLEFNSGNLFMAVSGQGSYVVEGFAKGKRQKERIETSKRTDTAVNPVMKVVFNEYGLGALASSFGKFIQKYIANDNRSRGVHLALVASGGLDMYVAPSIVTADEKRPTPGKKTKGGPEEIGPLYLLVKEAGGSVVDWEGQDIGNQKIDLLGASCPDLIAAATEELGKKFAKDIQSDPKIKAYILANSRRKT